LKSQKFSELATSFQIASGQQRQILAGGDILKARMLHKGILLSLLQREELLQTFVELALSDSSRSNFVIWSLNAAQQAGAAKTLA
jgi:hypothetical protein